MKKFLVLIVLLLSLVVLVGCTDDYYKKEEVDALIEERVSDLEQQIEALKLSPVEKFLFYLLANSEEIVFINIGEEYSETVNAYGYSKTYVYKVDSTTTFQISLVVDNNLEFTWYSNYAQDEGTTEELRPSLFGVSKKFNITVTEGYLVFDFESWDSSKNSTVTFILSIIT